VQHGHQQPRHREAVGDGSFLGDGRGQPRLAHVAQVEVLRHRCGAGQQQRTGLLAVDRLQRLGGRLAAAADELHLGEHQPAVPAVVALRLGEELLHLRDLLVQQFGALRGGGVAGGLPLRLGAQRALQVGERGLRGEWGQGTQEQGNQGEAHEGTIRTRQCFVSRRSGSAGRIRLAIRPLHNLRRCRAMPRA
jgi:hypothetical protein